MIPKMPVRCICGHTFYLIDCKSEQIRSKGGKYLNRDIEENCLGDCGKMQAQCPKCLYWNAVNGEDN